MGDCLSQVTASQEIRVVQEPQMTSASLSLPLSVFLLIKSNETFLLNQRRNSDWDINTKVCWTYFPAFKWLFWQHEATINVFLKPIKLSLQKMLLFWWNSPVKAFFSLMGITECWEATGAKCKHRIKGGILEFTPVIMTNIPQPVVKLYP